MKAPPRTVLRTFVEDGRALTLLRRGDQLELMLGNVPLLSSAALETERAFGRLAAGAPLEEPSPTVLVGGLGFGATARGVLDVLPVGGRVLVAEKLDAVVDVARNEARELTEAVLDDPRVTLVRTDVADVIAGADGLAAILLDVDNGPEWASFRSNARLYAEADLVRARRALRPGGVYAVWSGYAADAFVPRLRKAGFAPRVEPLVERGQVRARAYVGVAPAVSVT
jgi:spermidine synthase